LGFSGFLVFGGFFLVFAALVCWFRNLFGFVFFWLKKCLYYKFVQIWNLFKSEICSNMNFVRFKILCFLNNCQIWTFFKFEHFSNLNIFKF
jgi:hypothetical protein